MPVFGVYVYGHKVRFSVSVRANICSSFFYNVRSRDQMEELVKQRTRQLEAAMQVKTRFLATMSHVRVNIFFRYHFALIGLKWCIKESKCNPEKHHALFYSRYYFLYDDMCANMFIIKGNSHAAFGSAWLDYAVI